MKSNKLNIVASLLLITAGISAENYFDTAKNKASEYLTIVQNNVIDPIVKHKSTIAKVVAAMAGTTATVYVVDRYAFESKLFNYITCKKDANPSALDKAKALGSSALDKAKELQSLAYAKGQEFKSTAIDKAKKIQSSAYAKGQELYGKIPAKPTWFGVPAFVSNLFAKVNQPEQASTPTADNELNDLKYEYLLFTV